MSNTMNNTEGTPFKVGITRTQHGEQARFLQRLHHVLRDAQGRAILKRILEQYDLPVIQLNPRRRATLTRANRHVSA